MTHEHERERIWNTRLTSIFGMLILMGFLILIVVQVQISGVKHHENQECLNQQILARNQEALVRALREHDPTALDEHSAGIIAPANCDGS